MTHNAMENWGMGNDHVTTNARGIVHKGGLD